MDAHLRGNRVSLQVKADASVESLKQRAQSALVTGRGRLLNFSGEVLDRTKTIAETMLTSGDVLTLHVSQVQIKATRRVMAFSAFAALLGDRSVVSWGRGDAVVATAGPSRSSKLLRVPLLQSWVMDLWSPGVVPTMVATAVRCRISCEMCSRSKQLVMLSLQSWGMDLWLAGVIKASVGAAVRYRRS